MKISKKNEEIYKILKRLGNTNIEDDEEFKKVFEKINNEYLVNIEKGNIDLIKNLVLLDPETNRGYQNNIFPIKRNKIIELDKKGIEWVDKDKVRYLLPCTRNAFLKYYSPQSDIPTKWSNDDAENYLSNLKNTLNSIKGTINE